jgi:hypothetical protein
MSQIREISQKIPARLFRVNRIAYNQSSPLGSSFL